MTRNKVVTATLMLLLVLGGIAELSDLFAQRRGRGYRAGGSMRHAQKGNRNYNRSRSSSSRSRSRAQAGASTTRTTSQSRQRAPDGTTQKDLAGGGSLERSKTTTGDTTTRQTTYTDASGKQATATTQVKRQGDEASFNSDLKTREGGTRQSSGNVERDGEKVKYEREVQRSDGIKGEVKGEIKFDDGRVDKIEREAKVEGRFGEDIERKTELERKDGYWEFKDEFETSTGRKMEREGYAGRDIYGRPVAYGVTETRYHGDYGWVRGPNGGRVVSYLPSSYVPYYYYGYPYYSYGGLYYGRYYWGGYPYYYPAYPPYGAYYSTPPVGFTVHIHSGSTYYYDNYTYYGKSYSGGEVLYKVVPAPPGAEINSLPKEHATLTASGTQFHYYNNTFYRKTQQAGKTVFVVVEAPRGVKSVERLPAEFEPYPLGQVTYFQVGETFYLPYADGKKQVYIVVDKPTAPVPQAPATTAVAQSAGIGSTSLPPGSSQEIVVPAGTSLQIRTADDIDTGTNKSGDAFTGFLDADLSVNGSIVAARGSQVYGRLVEVEKAGNMKGKAELTLALTDIMIQHAAQPISSNQIRVDGESAKTLATVGGGAGLGALVGALADGGKGAAIGAGVGAAATPGKQVKIPKQTLLEFRLQQSLTLAKLSAAAD